MRFDIRVLERQSGYYPWTRDFWLVSYRTLAGTSRRIWTRRVDPTDYVYAHALVRKNAN